MKKLKRGDQAIPFRTSDYLDNHIDLESFRGSKLLLTFFRDASCPFCNIRLNQLIRNHDNFVANDIQIVAFFASSKERILDYAGKQEPPFPIIPDPSLVQYGLYGVRKSFVAKLKTMTNFSQVIKAMRSSFFNVESFTTADIVPADFMINEKLKIDRAYYGKDFSDHITIDEIINWKIIG